MIYIIQSSSGLQFRNLRPELLGVYNLLQLVFPNVKRKRGGWGDSGMLCSWKQGIH